MACAKSGALSWPGPGPKREVSRVLRAVCGVGNFVDEVPRGIEYFATGIALHQPGLGVELFRQDPKNGIASRAAGSDIGGHHG
jgi:hypothetical protein